MIYRLQLLRQQVETLLEVVGHPKRKQSIGVAAKGPAHV